MKIERLTRGEAEKAMHEWLEIYPNLPVISDEYKYLRNKFQELFEVVSKSAKEKGIGIRDYYTDAQFGISLYMFLKNQSWFTLRLATDDGFWRYLSLKVIPNIVAERWDKDNDSHYWSTPGRVWLKQIWWYVHLSWDTNEENTRKIIQSPNCSTDTILNFVERTGKKGTCVDAYRYIIRLYSLISSSDLAEYNKDIKIGELFRVVMKLNTARMMVFEPMLCAGGCEGYARKLFADAGFDIKKHRTISDVR